MTKKKLETDIFNGGTPEFYRNMKSIPDKNSVERPAFIKEERRKCREGININGVEIVGGLYTHLNYYHLMVDRKNNKGKVEKISSLPDFRDIDWITFNDYENSAKEGKIYTLFGARQLGKSEMQVSLTLRELSLFKNTEALALFSASIDKDTFVKKARNALDYGESFIYKPNIDKDWTKSEIRFGFTETDNTVKLAGTLYLYLTQDGNRIQSGSGKTISFLLMDEIARSPFRLVYEAVEPALTTDYGGLRCAPLFCFTGGEASKAHDAEVLVRYPDETKQLIFDYEEKPIGGRFLTGHYRKDCKVPMKFSDYVGKATGTWLDDEIIKVSDFDKAQKVIDDELEIAKKSPAAGALTLKRIFYPQSINDVFLTEGTNPFAGIIEGLKQHKENLLKNPLGVAVELYEENNKIHHRFSKKEPIKEYPIRSGFISEDTPIMIYDFPKYTDHYELHVMGNDLYNQAKTAISKSLGATYIIRRRHSDLSDNFMDCIVASYVGRPERPTDYFRNVEMLQQFYNCSILYEGSPNGFFQYFEAKNKTVYLMDTFSLQREINPNSKASNTKGLAPTVKNQEYLLTQVVDYTTEDIGNGKLGYTRIPDPLLIDELIAYDGEKNVDRYDAFAHALGALYSKKKYDAKPIDTINNRVVQNKPRPKQNAFGFAPTSKSKSAFGF